MNTFSFEHSEIFEFENDICQVNRSNYKEVEYFRIKSQVWETRKRSDLEQAWSDLKLTFIPLEKNLGRIKEEEYLSPKAKKLLELRQLVLKAYSEAEKPPVLSNFLQTLKLDGINISKATFYNWLRKEIGDEKASGITPRFNKRGGPKKRRCNTDAIRIANTVINDLLYSGEKFTVRYLYNEYILRMHEFNQLKEFNTPTLSYCTFWRIYNEIKDTFKLNKLRHGAPYAKLMNDGVKSSIEVERPLEIVEIDWTPLDVLIYNPTTNKTERPWLIVAVDAFSSYPLGFYLTLKAPDSLALKMCVLRCIEPKGYLKKSYPTVQNEWKACGLPKIIVLDNHAVNDSRDFEETCAKLGIKTHFCSVGSGHQKGHVERFFRTLNDKLIHSLPGTTFSNTIQRSQYKSEEKACITIQALNEILHIAVVDLIAHDFSIDLGGTPHEVWEKGFESNPHLHKEFVGNITELLPYLGRLEKRKITQTGVKVYGYSFTSPKLIELKHKLERVKKNNKLSVRINMLDTRMIHVYDPIDHIFVEA